jgi:peptide/nickel transport system substrate-binding protein
VKRRDFLKTVSAAAVTTGLGSGWTRDAGAQSRSDTLLTASESGPNALDGHIVGANRSTTGVVWNTYDRLVSFEVRRDAAGEGFYDFSRLTPEAAEDINLNDLSCTLKLRKGMTFHDGTLVTAKDVKYTFDRAIGVGGYPKSTMAAASLFRPEQFVLVDDHTFRIDFDRKDKLSPLYMGVHVVGIYNSDLVKKNSTPQDPWGQIFTRNNLASSGAYRVEKWTPGQEIILAVNPDWKCGPVPKVKRVIWRTVPAAGTRRALIEKGDVDVVYDLPPRDFSEIAGMKGLRTYSAAMESTMVYLGMNVTMKPFDDLRVRQALAYAVPYREIMKLALYDRARPLFGGPAKVTTPEWPQPHGYVTDLTKAKQLLVDAGYPNGIDVPLSFDLGAAATNEPLSVLLQENFAKVGVRLTLEKIAGANWRTTFTRKQLPLLVNLHGGWFGYPDYFFQLVYSGENTIFNTMSYQNKDMDKLIEGARFPESKASFEHDTIGFIQKAFDDLPNIPLYQPFLDVAMRSGIFGYTYWFHRELDYRSFKKA